MQSRARQSAAAARKGAALAVVQASGAAAGGGGVGQGGGGDDDDDDLAAASGETDAGAVVVDEDDRGSSAAVDPAVERAEQAERERAAAFVDGSLEEEPCFEVDLALDNKADNLVEQVLEDLKAVVRNSALLMVNVCLYAPVVRASLS